MCLRSHLMHRKSVFNKAYCTNQTMIWRLVVRQKIGTSVQFWVFWTQYFDPNLHLKPCNNHFSLPLENKKSLLLCWPKNFVAGCYHRRAKRARHAQHAERSFGRQRGCGAQPLVRRGPRTESEPLTGELGAEPPNFFRKIGVFGPHFGIESIKIQWHEARVSKIKIVKIQATGTSWAASANSACQTT